MKLAAVTLSNKRMETLDTFRLSDREAVRWGWGGGAGRKNPKIIYLFLLISVQITITVSCVGQYTGS